MMNRKRYVYVDTPLEKIEIEKFWNNKKVNIRNALEDFIIGADTIRSIQKKYNVYIASVYSHLSRLLEKGLIYEVKK